jgi:hypothetical protein
MENLTKNKSLFIGLSCLSIGCLFASFGYPLQKYEVWQQPGLDAFGNPTERVFVITETDRLKPYGFNKDTAISLAQVYEDYKFQKLFTLVLAALGSVYSLRIGQETCTNAELDSEIEEIKAKGRRELIVERIKHKLAMASKSQRLLFIEEMKVLMEEFGSPENEILEADEINAIYESNDQDSEKSEDLIFRESFPESMDTASQKAITKALQAGCNQEEVLRDVLGCSESTLEHGRAYFEYLSGTHK